MFRTGYVISCFIQHPKEYSIDVRIILCTDYTVYRLPFADAVLTLEPGHTKKAAHTNNFKPGTGKFVMHSVFIPLTKQVSYSRPCRP
jgi:hypothetical protein